MAGRNEGAGTPYKYLLVLEANCAEWIIPY